MTVTETRRLQGHGLYYPYFHIRDEGWLKIAALYWPKIIRVVPDGYPTANDTDTARVLINELDFIERQSPGSSVQAVAPRFLELLDEPDPRLSRTFSLPGRGNHVTIIDRRLGAVRTDQIDPDLASTLIEHRWALRVYSLSDYAAVVHLGTSPVSDSEGPGWIAMDPRLVTVYSSVLAEDVAIANRLQPTTDQMVPYTVASHWRTGGIAAALLDGPDDGAATAPTDDLPQALGLLALNLVVPASIDTIPVSKIVQIRQRYGQEFQAFGQAVGQAAYDLSELADIRDRSALDRYLKDEVASRFGAPMRELARQLRSVGIDAATTAVNVKTELPASVGLVGAAVITGHPLIAGTSAAALGVLGIRHGMRRRQEAVRQSAPAASFLLHARNELAPQTLLSQTLRRIARIAGTY